MLDWYTFLHNFTVHEAILTFVLLATISLCIFTWRRYDDVSAVGYFVPLSWLLITYATIYLHPDMPDLERRFWVRIGILLVCMAIVGARYIHILKEKARQDKQ